MTQPDSPAIVPDPPRRMGPAFATALAAFQAELPRIDKTQSATIPGKEGRAGYSYTYADLADISAKVLPALGRNGLAWTCLPTRDERGQFGLRYDLIHKTGESTGGWYPLPQQARPQELGSAITYGRRYCLCSVTGVVAEDDDDGAAAQQHAERNQQRPAGQPQRSAQRPPAQAPNGQRPDQSDEQGQQRTNGQPGQGQSVARPQPPIGQHAERMNPAEQLRKSVRYVLRSQTLAEAEDRVIKLAKAHELQDKLVGDLIDQDSAERLGLDDALRAKTNLLALADLVCCYIQKHDAPVILAQERVAVTDSNQLASTDGAPAAAATS